MIRRFFVSVGMGGITALASIPGLALAAPQTFAELVALFVLIINVATPTLVALALIFFLWRMLSVSAGVGGEKGGSMAARVRKVGLWGIGILFVMVSIWGILRIIEATFLTSGSFGSGFDEGDVDPCISFNDC